MTDLFANRYHLERELGRGSFGVVHLATDAELGRPVALKLLHAALAVDPATVQLFKHEAAILARLDQDNIIPVYDVGVSGDARYIVMKYVAGASLAQVLAKEGAQPVERVLAWLRQIAAGLDYAHVQGVLHRDLKPGNLLLDPARERILITDFGLAHAVQQSGGSSKQQSRQDASGTVGYLAPEVLQGEAATAASDRYSLGCVLYELLAGRPPFSGDNAMAIMFQHVQATPPALKLSGAVGAALAKQVAALLAKQPGQRPASAQVVVEAIAAAEADQRLAAERAEEQRKLDAAALAGEERIKRELALAAAAQQRLHDAEAVLAAQQDRQRVDAIHAEEQSKAAATAVGNAQMVAGAGEAALQRQASPIWQQIGIELVQIPAGEFLYGDDKKRVKLDAYAIARTPVTNQQYKTFVDATGHRAPTHWRDGKIPASKEQHPVINVSWADAQAFCKWAGVALPTEQQWEKAARGTDGRKYPWGNEAPDKHRCNFNQDVRDTTPVGNYPAGANGLLDMAGNVWEWCADGYEKDKYRVLRGGSWWTTNKESLRCASRYWRYPDHRDVSDGFRVVSPGS